MGDKNVLEIRHLRTSFFTQKGEIRAVDDVSLDVPEGKITGIVGESGCGKSMTARTVLRLLKYPGKLVGGEILFDGRDLTKLTEKEMAKIRGGEISMIFQEPMTSLNPVVRVGKQVEEALRLHRRLPAREARRQAVAMLDAVGIAEAEKRARCYPHELSGGMRQRVMIAMAMICKPKLLIADEPTTALDVTVQAQILNLMKRLRDNGTSILLISHDLGVVAQVCDTVYVMYAGRIVEQAEVCELFDHAAHPYTRGLLGAVSSLGSGAATLETIPGVVPNLLHLPAGCAFSLRCGECRADCAGHLPELRECAPGHRVRCHRIGEVSA